MIDWLYDLPAGSRVLDVASAGGSFAATGLGCMAIAVDEDAAVFRAKARAAGDAFGVAGRCEQLPLAAGTIDLVICNHALEHFGELERSLDEIARVLKPGGRLFLSVPYGYGLCDGLYRWLFEGGGHVNRFRREELARLVEAHTGLGLVRWQRLYSSFGYLRGIPELVKQGHENLQARVRWIGRRPRWMVELAHAALYAGTRFADGWVDTSTSLYGWAMWFDGTGDAPCETPGYVNVCGYCGAGNAPGGGRRRLRGWTCEGCGARNRFWFGG